MVRSSRDGLLFGYVKSYLGFLPEFKAWRFGELNNKAVKVEKFREHKHTEREAAACQDGLLENVSLCPGVADFRVCPSGGQGGSIRVAV